MLCPQCFWVSIQKEKPRGVLMVTRKLCYLFRVLPGPLALECHPGRPWPERPFSGKQQKQRPTQSSCAKPETLHSRPHRAAIHCSTGWWPLLLVIIEVCSKSWNNDYSFYICSKTCQVLLTFPLWKCCCHRIWRNFRQKSRLCCDAPTYINDFSFCFLLSLGC